MGYIGKILRNEYMLMNLDAVPYMTTLGGQTFAQAYSQMYQQMVFSGVSPANVSAQPFIETALGGAGSAYCQGLRQLHRRSGFQEHHAHQRNRRLRPVERHEQGARAGPWAAPCSARPVPGGTVGQSTSVGTNTSLGWGNYNAVFVTLRTTDWHGLTAISNFTCGRSLGTSQLAQPNSSSTPLTPYDLRASYGPQNFDYKFLYNLSMYYQPPVFRGQKGIVGHVLGGWTFSPLFTAQSGAGTGVSYSEGSGTGVQAFGEVGTPGTSAISSTSEARCRLYAIHRRYHRELQRVRRYWYQHLAGDPGERRRQDARTTA